MGVHLDISVAGAFFARSILGGKVARFHNAHLRHDIAQREQSAQTLQRWITKKATRPSTHASRFREQDFDG